MARTVAKCEICREWIDAERLEAVPGTRLCREHAEQINQYGGEFQTVAREDRTSKSGSLKINIGGVTTERVPNKRAIDQLKDDYEMQMEDN